MSKAIADLTNEHQAILSAIKIMESMVGTLETTASVDTKDIYDFIGFLKEFADKCHHGKEEGFLFPAMIAAGDPETSGPIRMMLAEHAQGRKLIQEMEESISNEREPVEVRANRKRICTSFKKSHTERKLGIVSHG